VGEVVRGGEGVYDGGRLCMVGQGCVWWGARGCANTRAAVHEVCALILVVQG
jgi:hypothetical protein